METIEVLTQALEIISDPERWTQGTFARDTTGRTCSYLSYAAVKFCATGAIFKIIGWDGCFPVPALMRLDEAALQLFSGEANSVSVNDHHGHAAVVYMFERAIELAQAESAVQPEPEEALVTV